MDIRMIAALACACACAPQPVSAQEAGGLAGMINAYRAAPGACEGGPAEPQGPLKAEPALSAVRLGPGAIIEVALERMGFAAAHASALFVTNANDAKVAMAALEKRYCATLLSTQFDAVGAYRSGNEWTVILARSAPPLPSVAYPDWRDAGQVILDGVNAARAQGRTCGERQFGPAAPLRWNAALGEAALAHSRDMAAQRYFNHIAKDGSDSALRAQRAGYAWRRIGENIAFGQSTPQDALDGWLTSPGHCANIMNPDFTEMGAAYGLPAERRPGVVFWTQVFGKPR